MLDADADADADFVVARTLLVSEIETFAPVALSGFPAQETQAGCVPLLQAPGSVPFMLAAELVALRRIVASSRTVTHLRQLHRAEELQLPHTDILPQSAPESSPRPGRIMPKKLHSYDWSVLESRR
ncbi:hypothetical protein [Actinoplanes sp. M2I2]|uniref:hypothetical protein n=1 Tax=Actinoplanes sp. M2I2 TaxID=1734444 RepID=UPI0020220A98|nr:hypothetical protein [Actinoplanes sp. M2I2]